MRSDPCIQTSEGVLCEEAKEAKSGQKRIYFLIVILLIVASSFQIDLFQFESDPTAQKHRNAVKPQTLSAPTTRKERSNMPKRKRKNEDGSKKEVKKYKGVEKRGEWFRVRIRIDGKRQYHGLFDTAKQAARAYYRAAIYAALKIVIKIVIILYARAHEQTPGKHITSSSRKKGKKKVGKANKQPFVSSLDWLKEKRIY